MKVIIADSASYRRRILALILKGSGHETVGEASEFGSVMPHGAETVIMEKDLPGRPIWSEAAGRLRPARLVVTGDESDDEELAKAIDGGAEGFILRPFTREGVLKALDELEAAG